MAKLLVEKLGCLIARTGTLETEGAPRTCLKEYLQQTGSILICAVSVQHYELSIGEIL